MGLGIDVERIAAIELNYLAKAEPDWDSRRVITRVESHGGRQVRVISMRQIEEDQRLRDGHMTADSRRRLLISPQHTQETPTLRRKDDTSGAHLQLVCTEIGVGASRNRDKRSETEGDFLWQPDVKLTESEIIDLLVAEAGARSTSRRQVRDDCRIDVHDLLNGRVLQRAVDGLFGALAGWRAVANHLDRPSHDRQSQHEVGEVLKRFPLKLRAGLALVGESARYNVRLVAGNTVTVRIASP